MNERNSRFGGLWPLFVLVVLVTLLGGSAVAQEETTASSTIPGVFGEIVEVRLINIEVVVTDRDGNRVTDLDPSTFRLLVDGEEVPIEYFSEIRGGIAVEPEGAPAEVEPAPGTAVGEPVGTSYLIFIDEFFPIARDRNIVLDEILGDIAGLGPEDRAAVVAFNGRDLEMLSSWTSSVDELQQVLKAARERPSLGLQRIAERNRFDEAGRVLFASELLRQDASLGATLDSYLTNEELFYARMLSGQVERGVLAAAATLRSFAKPPGRKVMLLAVGSWPFLPADFVVSDMRRMVFASEVKSGGNLFRPLTEAANRLGYTLYPIDVPGFDRADSDIGSNYRSSAVRGPYNNTLWDPRGGSGRDAAFARELEAHYTLEFLAEQTGGEALLNSARREAFERVRADTRSYYWLGFTPRWQGDDSHHRIDVQLTDPSLRVRFRSGFLDLSRVQETTMEVESALLFGSPPSDEPLNLSFGRPQKGGFRKMDIPLNIDIPLERVTFLPTSEGRHEARLELRVGVVDDTGAQADIPVVPLTINRAEPPAAGETYSHAVTLKMRRERHRAVVAIYDQAGGSMLSGTAVVSP